MFFSGNNLIPEPKAEPLNGWFATTIGAASGAAVALIAMLVALIYILRRGEERRGRGRNENGSREEGELGQNKKGETIQLQADPPDILEQKASPYMTEGASHALILDHDKVPRKFFGY